MSSYNGSAINPKTGLVQSAEFLDDWFGRHKYGVRFDGHGGDVYPMENIQEVVSTESAAPITRFASAESIVEKPKTREASETVTDLIQASVLDYMCKDIHKKNVQAGWWDQAGNPLVVPTKLALIVSECVEALEGYRRDKMDDKLTDETMIAVELADVLIRVFDLCGYLGINVGTILAKKAAFNAERSDHKPENRAKAGGKKF